MSGPAFMPLGTRVVASGALGSTPLGTAPLGGNLWTPYVLPVPQPGSDRLDASEHKIYGDIVHERDGLIVGILSRGSRRKWIQVWSAISREDALYLLTFADLRRFYMLPTGDPDVSRVAVYWNNAEVAAKSLRAGYRSVEAELIELTGPAAATT